MESYIGDDSIILIRGMKDGKDNVPDEYIDDLQEDLAALGFDSGILTESSAPVSRRL